LVVKNAPPASMTVPSTDGVPVQEKILVDEEKEMAKDEAESKEPSFPEEAKIEDKEEPFQESEKEVAVLAKLGEISCLYLFSVSPYLGSQKGKQRS
jgi:hypothetical protein